MMELSFVERVLEAKRLGDDTTVAGVSIDSREIRENELFIAIRGARFDGHDFVAEAAQNGATAALVEAPDDEVALTQIVVEDTQVALGQLAKAWRERFEVPIVAVTGSNGKTTVKEMIGAALRSGGSGLVSHGNFNNLIGLPLSLLRLRQSHGFGVVEFGMNQPGEIERLSSITKPDVAVVTNASSAHLERLLTVKSVAREKARIATHLKDEGTLVANADDPNVAVFLEAAKGRRAITFAIESEADVTATVELQPMGSRAQVSTPAGQVEIVLSVPGEHNVRNALAATAAALEVGVSLSEVKSALESIRSVPGRLVPCEHMAGGRLIDDTYNANPASLSAAIDVLSDLGGDRRLIFGDMLELGDKAEEFHRCAARQARSKGIGRLYTYGQLSRHAADEFGYGARHYDSLSDLAADLRNEIDSTTSLLVKGSRGMKMETVVALLKQPQAETGGERQC